MATVDGVNIYDGWQDVVATVREIINKEAAGSVEMNVPDVSSRRNPGDHYDHYLAGVLALSASKNACYNNVLYTGYNVVKCPPKLSSTEIAFKQSLLKNIGTELDGAGYPDCQDPWHMSFTENEYSVNEPDACNYPDSDIFYIRKFGLRQEDDEKDEGNYACVLYPNPATSFLHLSVTDKERTPAAVSIRDVYGNTKKTFRQPEVGYAWEMLLDIQELSAGVYFLEIVSGNRKTVQRFLKT